jgi:hypothetical protein
MEPMATMTPVFVGGCDRSGTTVLGAMLGTHSDCLCVPESQFIIAAISSPRFSRSNLDVAAALDLIANHPRFRIWQTGLGESTTSPRPTATSYAELIEWLVTRYGTKCGKPSARIWVDHTPSNVKYAASLFELFPGGKLVHIVRDGRAVASSLLRRVARVRYEDLISRPEETLKRLCAFAGIDYQPGMVEGTGFRVPAFTRAQHALVGQRPSPSRIDAWRGELSPRQVEIFESIAGDMLTYLGYSATYGPRAQPMSTSERMVAHLRQYQMFMGNYWSSLKLYWAARHPFLR